MLLLLQATQAADSVQVAADELMKEAIANADGLDKLSLITQQLIDGIRAGERILIAVLVFVVGRFLISLLNKFIRRLMDKRKVDVSIKTFVRSLVNILLTILLIISVVGALGVETTSFAACWHLPVWLLVWLYPVICKTLPVDWLFFCSNLIKLAIG